MTSSATQTEVFRALGASATTLNQSSLIARIAVKYSSRSAGLIRYAAICAS